MIYHFILDFIINALNLHANHVIYALPIFIGVIQYGFVPLIASNDSASLALAAACPWSASVYVPRPIVVGSGESIYMFSGYGPIGFGGPYTPNCGDFAGTYDIDGQSNIVLFDMAGGGIIPAVAYDGTVPSITVYTAPTISMVSGSTSTFLSRFSIDKPGIYHIGTNTAYTFSGDPTVYGGVVAPYFAGEIVMVTGSGTVTKNNLSVTYASGSQLAYKNYFNDIILYNNSTYGPSYDPYYINDSTESIVPVQATTYSVSYPCDTTQSGYLIGEFNGSVIGRIEGNINKIVNQSYTSSYYTPTFSGSFNGHVNGKICGMFAGTGSMTGIFDAGPVPLASASINAGAVAPYSGLVSGTISGSITGSACCGITYETLSMYPLEYVALNDNRLRLYYVLSNSLIDTYELKYIETKPLV